jgi:peptide/nickel transport system substrate-binding protein
MSRKTNQISFAAVALSLTLVFTGCASGSPVETIIVGQSGSVDQLDPAAIYSSQSQEVAFQSFGSLANAIPGSIELLPDLADSYSYREPYLFEVKLRPNLRFSNGNDLTASDVKHSIDRVRNIQAPTNPSILLQYIGNVIVEDALTLTLELKNEYDQTIYSVLSSVATVIVDEQEFPADRILTPEEVIEANGFSGPYRVTSFIPGSLISLEVNPRYAGIWGSPRNAGIILKYYANNNNLALDIQTDQLDVAMIWRSLPPQSVRNALRKNKRLDLARSPGSVPIYLSFRVDAQPFGSQRPDADPLKALAVRQALAHLIDRKELLGSAYGGAVAPSYSFVPKGITGFSPVLRSLYGDGSGKPSLKKARSVLTAAGISQPVKLRILFSPERYGEMTEVLISTLKDQIEKDGFFTLDVYTAEWGALREIRVAESPEYDLFLLQWGPDFADPDNYLSPVFSSNGWLATGYVNPDLDQKMAKSVSVSETVFRQGLLMDVQKVLAENLPAIVLGMDGRSALVHERVTGLDEVLDVTFKVKYAHLSKLSKEE